MKKEITIYVYSECHPCRGQIVRDTSPYIDSRSGRVSNDIYAAYIGSAASIVAECRRDIARIEYFRPSFTRDIAQSVIAYLS